MISQAFGVLRVRTTAAEQQDNVLSESAISPRPSFSFDTPAPSPMDGVTTEVSPTHAPKVTKREQKRYSNNLFGTGKPRDVPIRNVQGGDWRDAPSDTGSDVNTFSRTLRTKFNFLRSGSPEACSSGISTPPNPNVFTDRGSSSTSKTTILDSSPDTSTEIQPLHTFRLNTPIYASPVLKEVNWEIEGEAKEGRVDDIILLRSPSDGQRQMAIDYEDDLVCHDQGGARPFFLNCIHRNGGGKPSRKSSPLQRCLAMIT